jgi:3-deoxy-D-manno-octulosonic-acid transferase
MLAQLGVPSNALLLVAGSTHPGEEVIIARQYLRLRARHPRLFLILVPRHFERARQIGRDLRKCGLRFVYRSEIRSSARYNSGEIDCLLVDSTGELPHFYKYASVIFVGKSLVGKGGQNPIEPAAVAKAMVFGPNMQNFTEVVRLFLQSDAAVQVRDEDELERVLDELISDEARREILGRNAQRVVLENRGATQRTVNLLLPYLKDSNMYVAPQT